MEDKFIGGWGLKVGMCCRSGKVLCFQKFCCCKVECSVDKSLVAFLDPPLLPFSTLKGT